MMMWMQISEIELNKNFQKYRARHIVFVLLRKKGKSTNDVSAGKFFSDVLTGEK